MQPGPLPCTPKGIVELLRRFDVPIKGAEVTVVGRGITVGRALGLLLTRRSENATVTLCHTATRDLAAHTRAADIVVAAAGVPGLITADMVRPGAAVLDVGVSRVDGKLAGDVAADVRDVAGLGRAQPRRRRPDDPRDAARQRRRGRRAGRLTAHVRRPPPSTRVAASAYVSRAAPSRTRNGGLGDRPRKCAAAEGDRGSHQLALRPAVLCAGRPGPCAACPGAPGLRVSPVVRTPDTRPSIGGRPWGTCTGGSGRTRPIAMTSLASRVRRLAPSGMRNFW